jgi:hypothetical protein
LPALWPDERAIATLERFGIEADDVRNHGDQNSFKPSNIGAKRKSYESIAFQLCRRHQDSSQRKREDCGGSYREVSAIGTCIVGSVGMIQQWSKDCHVIRIDNVGGLEAVQNSRPRSVSFDFAEQLMPSQYSLPGQPNTRVRMAGIGGSEW